MPEDVDATMQPLKPARLHPTPDRPVADTAREQLVARDQPALLGGKPLNSTLTGADGGHNCGRTRGTATVPDFRPTSVETP